MALNHLLMTKEIFKTTNYFIKMEKKTAVEWLQERISIGLTYEQEVLFEGLFVVAKEIEKEQMHAEYMRGWRDGLTKQKNN